MHIESKAHLKHAGTKPKKPITTFFLKGVQQSASTSTLRPMIPGLLSNKLPILPTPQPVYSTTPNTPLPSDTTVICEALNIIRRIRTSANQLKAPVPEATVLDTMA